LPTILENSINRFCDNNMDTFIFATNQIISSIAFGVLLWLGLFTGLFYSLFRKAINKEKIDFFDTNLVFRFIFFVYYGIPSLYYFFIPPAVDDFRQVTLNMVLVLAILGLIFFDLGRKIAIHQQWQRFFESSEIDEQKVAKLTVIFFVIALLSFIIFIFSVGGLNSYIQNWGKTGDLTKGKMYLLWGVLLSKLAFLVNFAFHLKGKKTLAPFLLYALGGISFLLIMLIGARLLIIVYILECLILYHYLKKEIPVKKLLIAALVIFIVFIVLMGEVRNHTWFQDMSLLEQIKTRLGDFSNYIYLLVNNYFDSVRNTIIILENTPSRFSYEWGRTYLDLLVRPIPYMFRPDIVKNSEILLATFQGRILPLLGELYLNFSLAGIVIGTFFLGLFAKASSFFLRFNKANISAVLLYATLVAVTMMWVRGQFANHTPLFLMDFIGFFVFIKLSQKSAKG